VNNLSSSSICYLAGVGEDISFDVDLIKATECTAFAFDPTPRAIAYALKQSVDGWNFIASGIAGRDGVHKFYEPANAQHVSHSITNMQNTERYFEANCLRLSSLMRNLGHAHVDLLKLDIEGAENDVIDDIVRGTVGPTQLCIEFDDPGGLRALVTRIRALKAMGYRLISVEGRNTLFYAPAFKIELES
jgi:FkbM family methyltransferase